MSLSLVRCLLQLYKTEKEITQDKFVDNRRKDVLNVFIMEWLIFMNTTAKVLFERCVKVYLYPIKYLLICERDTF